MRRSEGEEEEKTDVSTEETIRASALHRNPWGLLEEQKSQYVHSKKSKRESGRRWPEQQAEAREIMQESCGPQKVDWAPFYMTWKIMEDNTTAV